MLWKLIHSPLGVLLKFETQKKLPANVRIMGWVSLLTDVSSEMIFPLLPVFLTTVLGAGSLVLGLIEGFADSISSLLNLVGGTLSDKAKKRKVFVLLGYGVSTLMRPLMAIAPHWSSVLAIRFSDRIGKGIRSAPRDALIAATIKNEERGRAFGYHRMMDHTGAVIGSLVSALLIALMPGQYRLIFGLAAIPGIISFIVLTRLKEAPNLEPVILGEKSGIIFHGLPKRLKAFLVLLFIFTLGNATDAFLILRLKDGGLPVALIPLTWGAFSLVKAYSNSFFGKLSDHVSRRALLISGWAFYALVYFIFSFELPLFFLVGLFWVYGIYYGLTEGPEKALLAEWGPPEHHGRIFGWYNLILGIGLLPASVIFGFLWDRYGYSRAFWFGAAMALVPMLLLLPRKWWGSSEN